MTTKCLIPSSGLAFARAVAGASSAPSSPSHTSLRIAPPPETGGSYALSRVPEGDTIHHAANRIRPVLAGHVPDEIATPHPRFGRDRWPERLAGRAVTAVDAHGKHLLLRFEGDLVIHSHLRMRGRWSVRDAAERRPGGTWLALRRGDREVRQLNGPVLELMTASRARFDQRLAGLGPDILAPEAAEPAIRRRRRADAPTRPIGAALLDQRIVAGIGNMCKAEGCFAAAVDPWRR